jgi:membrane-anchored protein YejM (alkaline phosphatase superfamily)
MKKILKYIKNLFTSKKEEKKYYSFLNKEYVENVNSLIKKIDNISNKKKLPSKFEIEENTENLEVMDNEIKKVIKRLNKLQETIEEKKTKLRVDFKESDIIKLQNLLTKKNKK